MVHKFYFNTFPNPLGFALSFPTLRLVLPMLSQYMLFPVKHNSRAMWNGVTFFDWACPLNNLCGLFISQAEISQMPTLHWAKGFWEIFEDNYWKIIFCGKENPVTRTNLGAASWSGSGWGLKYHWRSDLLSTRSGADGCYTEDRYSNVFEQCAWRADQMGCDTHSPG